MKWYHPLAVIFYAFLVWLFLSLTFAFAQEQPKDTKAPFGYAYMTKSGKKYHLFSDCFVLKGREVRLVLIDSLDVCKHCVNKLGAIENSK